VIFSLENNRIAAGTKIFLLAGILGGILPHSVFAFEGLRYEIKANISVEAKTLSAKQQVTFTNNSSETLKEVYFHIYPNRKYRPDEEKFIRRYGGYFKVNPFPEGLPDKGMDIHSVTVDGQDAKFMIEGEDATLLQVSLATPLSPQETINIEMSYDVILPHAYARFGWHDRIIKLSHWYPILSVYDKNGWHTYPFYPFHRPFFSEAANYEVTVTVPQDQVMIHTGLKDSEKSLGDGRKEVVLKSDMPVRDFTIAMSPDYKMVEGAFNGIALKSFYLPSDKAAAQDALVFAKDLMQYYTKLFGPYPYQEFSIAPVPLGYGGEQMSNMVFIDTRVYRLPGFLKRYFDFMVSHEVGHQWIYNLVGMNEYGEMWLEEGVNSHFILQYLEDKYGKDAEIIDYPHWFKDYEWILPKLTFKRTRDYRYKMIARIGYDHAVVDKLSKFKEPSSIFSLTYGKGARIVAMVKAVMGDESFERLFERIFDAYRFKNLSIDDFIDMAEQESGQDLSSFFDDWLYTDKKFDYAVRDVRKNKIFLENRGGIVMPAEIKVTFKDRDEKMYVWQGQTVFIETPKDKAMARVMIDPEDKLLDIDRTNNHWPRKLNVKPVPLYLGLYDIPVFLPEDSYNLVFGPEVGGSSLGIKASLQKPFDQIFYVATGYEFGEQLHHSRVGYQLNNVLNTQTALGFEIADTQDGDGDDDDVLSGKVYLRRELWPAQYGLMDINDHVTLYLVRNQRLSDHRELLSGQEDTRNLDYSRRDESIVGAALRWNRSGPYPDPSEGYRVDALAESGGHFWGAHDYFYRTDLDISVYQPLSLKTRIAFRIKYGWGYPNDKELFYIGGIDGLRGYDRKTIRGANALLGSVEYRFPLMEDLNVRFLDNIFGLDGIGGVVFLDVGQAWYSNMDDTNLKVDAGAGLRFTINVGSLLEKVVVRLDVAHPVNDDNGDTHFWFGLNQAF